LERAGGSVSIRIIGKFQGGFHKSAAIQEASAEHLIRNAESGINNTIHCLLAIRNSWFVGASDARAQSDLLQRAFLALPAPLWPGAVEQGPGGAAPAGDGGQWDQGGSAGGEI